MTTTYLSHSEVSNDGLRARVWRFRVEIERNKVLALLDSYSEAERASTRHKFKRTDRFYNRLGRATHDETRLTYDQVPWPEGLDARIREATADLIQVAASYERHNDVAIAGVPQPRDGEWREIDEVEMAKPAFGF